MKSSSYQNSRRIVLVAIVACLAKLSIAAPVQDEPGNVMYRLRGAPEQLDEYSPRIYDFQLMQSTAKEFSNGNSFIMLNPKKNRIFSSLPIRSHIVSG